MVEVDDAVVEWPGRDEGPRNRLALAEVRLARDADDIARLGIEGTINDEPVQLNGQIGPLDSGWTGRDVSFTVDGTVAEFTLAAEGLVDDLAKPARPRLTLEVEAPDADALEQWFNLPEMSSDPVRLSVTLQQEAEDMLLDADFTTGDWTARADGRVSDLQGFRRAELAITATGDNGDALFALFGVRDVPDASFDVAGRLQRDDSGLRVEDITVRYGTATLGGSAELPAFPDLAGAIVDVQAKGDDLGRFRRAFGFEGFLQGPFDVTATLRPGGSDGIGVEGRAAVDRGTLTVNGQLTTAPDLAGSTLEVNASGSDARALAEDFGIAGFPDGPWSLEAPLSLSAGGVRLGAGTRVDIDDHRLEASGTVDHGGLGPETNLDFALVTPSLKRLVAGFGAGDWPERPLHAEGRFLGRADRLIIEQLSVASGPDQASGRVEIPLAPLDDEPIRFALEVAIANVTDTLPDLGPFSPSPVPLSGAVRFAWGGGRLDVDQAQLAWGDVDLDANGAVDWPPASGRSDLSLRIEAPDLANLGTLGGDPLPSGPLLLEARITESGDSLSLAVEQLVVWGSELAGSLSADFTAKPVRYRADMSARTVDIGRWRTAVNDKDEDVVDQPPADGRLIPDTPLSLDGLAGIDAEWRLDADRVVLRTTEFTDASFAGHIRDGVLRIDRLHGSPPIGSFAFSGGLAPAAAGARLELEAELEEAYLNPADESAEALAEAPRIDARLRLTGTGTTVREVAATLSGQALVTSGSGRVPNSGVSILFGDFIGELFGRLNPFVQREPYTQLDCVAGSWLIEDGIAQTEPAFAMRTSKIAIIAVGGIDLGSEKVDIDFRTRARRGIGISAGEFINPFIKVTGTLARPSVTLDPGGTLISGGAAFLTGGLSLLAKALFDRLIASNTPCEDVLAKAPPFDEAGATTN